jgi:hypothetical protein
MCNIIRGKINLSVSAKMYCEIHTGSHRAKLIYCDCPGSSLNTSSQSQLLEDTCSPYLTLHMVNGEQCKLCLSCKHVVEGRKSMEPWQV